MDWRELYDDQAQEGADGKGKKKRKHKKHKKDKHVRPRTPRRWQWQCETCHTPCRHSFSRAYILIVLSICNSI
jgi:hypothetical protein